jgi:Tfp pilus assembly protein PilF
MYYFPSPMPLIAVLTVATGLAIAPDPQTLPRDETRSPTFGAHVNYGMKALEAGQYKEALEHLLYAHNYCPHLKVDNRNNRTWLIATIHLAMCCEEMGAQEMADRYYAKAGRFSNIANHIRSGAAWRRMRRKAEAEVRQKELVDQTEFPR